MVFALVNGVAKWATHKKDGEYYFEGDTIPEGSEEVEQPSQAILEKAEKLKGKTYSKSEFEKMLFTTNTEEEIEILRQSIAELTYIIAMGGM